MSLVSIFRRPVRALLGVAASIAVLLGSGLVPVSSGDLQSQIDAGRSSASSLRSAIAAETARIQQTAGGLADAERRLSAVQGELAARESQLRAVQNSLIAARDHLVQLENRLQQATRALSANLVSAYESSRPDVVSVILESHGFTDLLEKMSFLRRIGHQDAAVVGSTRAAREAVFRQARALAALEKRDRALTDEVLAQRNQVAALRAALLNRQIAQESARSANASKLHQLNSRLHSLEARAAAEARRAAASANAAVPGGIAVNTGGMAQPPKPEYLRISGVDVPGSV